MALDEADPPPPELTVALPVNWAEGEPEAQAVADGDPDWLRVTAPGSEGVISALAELQALSCAEEVPSAVPLSPKLLPLAHTDSVLVGRAL